MANRMVTKTNANFNPNDKHLMFKARKIKLVLTDNDGVLTDTGVYYSEEGEMFKRFSIRDGMGVERLRNELGVETGIISGEVSGSLKKRAEKLNITNVYLGVKDKKTLFAEIIKSHKINADNVAYIGDDVNDIEIMKLVGLTATPADGMPEIREMADYVCQQRGGNGAFREFAELIIELNAK